MKKTLILLGAAIVTQGMMPSGAEARLVRYEINGKQYSYSTNNRAQTAEARKRIAAAKAAEAAKAQAEAEKARNPLAAAFGSTTQKEAKAADDRLRQILAGPTEYMAVTQPARASAGEPTGKLQDRRPQETKIQERKPEERKPQGKPLRPASVEPAQPSTAAVRAPAQPVLASAAAASLAVAEPVGPQRQAKVRSVSFDMQTGIRTTIMIDGTVEEEPFDSSVLAVLAPEPAKANSLTAFVNQLRRMPPEGMTGSVRTTVAEPEDGSLIRHR